MLDLARNFGKEAAMTAGLDTAIGDVVVILDADLQDPPELIGDMLSLWHDGYEVVLGRRIDRMSDSFLKRATARWSIVGTTCWLRFLFPTTWVISV